MGFRAKNLIPLVDRTPTATTATIPFWRSAEVKPAVTPNSLIRGESRSMSPVGNMAVKRNSSE